MSKEPDCRCTEELCFKWCFQSSLFTNPYRPRDDYGETKGGRLRWTLSVMIFTPTNSPNGTVKAARWKSETRFKSAVGPPTVNMLQLINEFPDSTGRRAHRFQSCPCRTSPTKCVSIRGCAAPHGKDAARGGASPTLAPGLFTCCVG